MALDFTSAKTKIRAKGVEIVSDDRAHWVSDQSLAWTIGKPLYLAFYDQIRNKREVYAPNDFDASIITENAHLRSSPEYQQALTKLQNYPTRSYIQLWRDLKRWHAETVVAISEYDWSESPGLTVALAAEPTMSGYLEGTLNYLANTTQKFKYSELLNRLHPFRNLLPESRQTLNYGVLPSQPMNQSSSDETVDLTRQLNSSTNWFWILFWTLLLGALILGLILWLSGQISKKTN